MALWASAASLDHSEGSLTAPTIANFGEYWTHQTGKRLLSFQLPSLMSDLNPQSLLPWLFCKADKKSTDH